MPPSSPRHSRFRATTARPRTSPSRRSAPAAAPRATEPSGSSAVYPLHMKYALIVLSLLVCLAAFAKGSDSLANSQMPSVVTVPAAAQPSAHFDADAATEAYLAEIPPAARAR